MTASEKILLTLVRKSGPGHSVVWDPSRPMALGESLRWAIERTGGGIRVRDISGTIGDPRSAHVLEIRETDLDDGKAVALSRDEKLHVRRARKMAPAYLSAPSKEGAPLWLYECAGSWVKAARQVTGADTVEAAGRPAFAIRPASGGVEISPLPGGTAQALFRASESAPEAPLSSPLRLAAASANGASIRIGAITWRFAPAVTPVARGAHVAAPLDAETRTFHKSLQTTGGALALLLAIVVFWPKPKPEEAELVPPQFAKIVMGNPRAAEKAPAAGGGSSAPAKTEDTQLVRAFRAKALRNAVQGLLKGGLTTLLAQSELVSGDHAARARTALSSDKSALSPTAPLAGNTGAKPVAVASLGGGAGSGGGVGYGMGKAAGVEGQGSAFVELDFGSGSVEQGLSKDEVGKVIHSHMSEIRYCYESAILRAPEVEGRLVVDFTIASTGIVATSAVKESTLPDARLDDCILRRLVTWKFPKPKGGVSVAVSYPFIFKTLGG